jgi:hypothetical protein
VQVDPREQCHWHATCPSGADEGVKRVLEGANASQMGVQAFVMRGMASAVVRCEAQPCVRCKQRLFGQ